LNVKDAKGHGSDKRGETAPSPATVEALRANVRAGATGHYHAGLKRAVHGQFGNSRGRGGGGGGGSGGGQSGGGRFGGGQSGGHARQIAKRHGVDTAQLGPPRQQIENQQVQNKPTQFAATANARRVRTK
jgi:hypothetical protein